MLGRSRLVRRLLWAGALAWVVGACIGSRVPGFQTAPTPCTSDADCQGGQTCVVGMCSRPGTVERGGDCLATRDCVAGLYCNRTTGVCATGGTGEDGAACTSDAQCRPPLYCGHSQFFGACTPSGSTDLDGACTTTKDCLAGLYCGQGLTCQPYAQAFPPFTGVTCADEGPFRAYFEVPRPARPPADFYRLPFPNDIRVTGGALDISDFPRPGPTSLGLDLVKLYVDTWSEDFDGFSGIGGITFRFSGEVDYASATLDVVKLIDVTPGPTFSNQMARTWTIDNGRNKYACAHTLHMRTWADRPLLPRHTYAAIVTTGMKSTRHEPAAPDADLVAVLGATRPADPALAHAWDAYAPLRALVAAAGDSAPAIAGAALFTVQDMTGHMARLAADLTTRPAPALSALTLCAAGVTSPCDDGTPARACGAANDLFHEIHGRFSVPIYQAGTPPYETPAMGGAIVETGGAPAPVRTEQVCFALALPKRVAPRGGWPLVVYHHGTGGSMRTAITDGTAATLAASPTPAALFAFDAVAHGARRGSSRKPPDDLVFNPLNPRAARDNFLQGAVDVLQALRLPAVAIAAGASPTGAAIAFNPAAVAYFGHSQGSTSGEIALPFTTAPALAVLSGAGAYLTMSLLDKTMPVDIASGLAEVIGEPLSVEHPVMAILQSVFDRADPVNYNPLIVASPLAGVPSKHVYMSWGAGDSYTPWSTLEANARSLGIPPVAPLLEDYMVRGILRPVTGNFRAGDGALRTAAVFQYRPDDHDGHFVAQENPAAIADWSAFLSSFFATGTPTVP